MTEAAASYRFGTFELRLARRQLLREGVPQKVGGRAFDLLLALLERRERVVPKAELMDLVWPKLVVEENNLQVHVMALRRLLGPDAIATVPGRGYRFAATIDDDAPAPKAASSTPPAPLPPLIGRDADLQALDRMVAEERLVTLLGAGGVGKSRLAQHLMQQRRGAHAHGLAWIDLTTIADLGALIGSIAAAADVPLGHGDPKRALAIALVPLRMLLVLDNAEHLVDELTGVAQALHAAAPQLHLLVTSQVPLRLSAERLYRLDPLALADPSASLEQAAACAAVQLFVERVRASDRHFVLGAHNLAPVISLTRRLDGLPLAIEMAAARVPALSPAQLDQALRERFRVLTTGDPTAPARQHSLQAAMQWTHALLGPVEQAVFRRLAVFAGSFSLDAAQRVCHDERFDEWQVLEAVAALVDHSLVAPPAHEPPRYRLLDTPHAFARQLLAASGEDAAIRRRHLETMRLRYEAAYEQHLQADRQVGEWLAAIAPDNDNGCQALAWAVEHDPSGAVALAPGLAQALLRAHPQRFAVWRQTESLLHDGLPAPLRARWLLGWAQFWSGNKPQLCRPRAEQAAQLFRAAGHRVGEYRAIAIVAGQFHGHAGADHRAALARMRALEDPAWPAGLRVLRPYAEALLCTVEQRYDEALALGNRCLQLDAEAGRDGGVSRQLGMMYVEILAGRYDAAIARGNAARDRMLARRRHAPPSGVDMFIVLAWLLKGEPEPARELAPGVWQAACQYDQQGPVALILALLAACEQRVAAAALLRGYAGAAFERTRVFPMQSATLTAERTAALLRQTLDAAAQARLEAAGARLSDAAAGNVAFAREDADPERYAPGA